MICLDTNVVSESMRPTPDRTAAGWLERQPLSQTCITAVTKAELLFGVARMPAGKRRNQRFQEVKELLDALDDRILPFDAEAAGYYADLLAQRRALGRPMSTHDAQIAAICRAHRMPLATRNTSDFTDCGLSLIDPWLA